MYNNIHYANQFENEEEKVKPNIKTLYEKLEKEFGIEDVKTIGLIGKVSAHSRIKALLEGKQIERIRRGRYKKLYSTIREEESDETQETNQTETTQNNEN